MAKTGKRKAQRKRPQKKRKRGGKLDVQKLLAKTGKEFHWPGYQYMGPGTHSLTWRNDSREVIRASID